jgi:DNA-binding GntR family transcriptional regulator
LGELAHVGRSGDPRKFVRLANALIDLVNAGHLRPGDLVPMDPLRNFGGGLSRQTIGKAMQMLEIEGILQRWPGLGYTVCDLTEPAAAPRHSDRDRAG